MRNSINEEKSTVRALRLIELTGWAKLKENCNKVTAYIKNGTRFPFTHTHTHTHTQNEK